MRIGIGGEGGTIDVAVDSVRRAKDAGFTSAWFSNIFGLDGMTACAIVGREVPDITLGTFVVPTYSRHPLYMAQQAMTAQAATGGRFVLGIGLSHQIVIEGMLGLSFEKPARHMREYLEVLMPILEDGSVQHAGEVYQVNNTFGPARAARYCEVVARPDLGGWVRIGAEDQPGGDAANGSAPAGCVGNTSSICCGCFPFGTWVVGPRLLSVITPPKEDAWLHSTTILSPPAVPSMRSWTPISMGA